MPYFDNFLYFLGNMFFFQLQVSLSPFMAKTPIVPVLWRPSNLLEDLDGEGVCLSPWAQLPTPETSWGLTSSQLQNYLEGSLDIQDYSFEFLDLTEEL